MNRAMRSIGRAGARSFGAGAVVLVLVLSGGPVHGEPGTEAAALQPRLEVLRSVVLEKSSGRVDQVLALPDGGFATRDYSWETPEHQKIELFDPSGHRRGEIARYGLGPGQYHRLADLAVHPTGDLWVADYGSTRLLRYSPDGRVRQTVLVQNPSFRPRAVEVDRERRALYVAGCYPTDTYLDRGCLLVHRYELDRGAFRGSFVETQPGVVERLWSGRSGFDLTLGGDGKVYLLHQASLDLLRLDPDSGDVETIRIDTTTAEEPPALTPEVITSIEGMHSALEKSFRMERVEAAGPWLAVSIARPRGKGYLVVLFRDGSQVTSDVPAPGRLVGASGDGGFLFLRRDEDRFVLDVAHPTAGAER